MALAARLNLRMQKELKLLITDPPPGVSLVSPENDSPSTFSDIVAKIMGPEGTAYFGGIFTIKVSIPERYPFQPPNVTFATPIYHPNIDNGGRICLDILNLPPKGAWQPSLNISTVLTSIGLLLADPNPDDGLMLETSREYKYNRQVFEEKARSYTEKYAKAEFSGSNPDASTMIMSEGMTQSELYGKDPILEDNVSRKKVCVAGDRLSLRQAAVTRKCGDNKDNNVQTTTVSLTLLQNVEQPSPKQISLGHKATQDEDLMQNHVLQVSNKEPEMKQVYKAIEMTVVSDSEESEDESARSGRPRFSVLRKRRGRSTG